MLLGPSSLVMYFFCDVFFPGRANLLEILSEECLLIKHWVVMTRMMFRVMFILSLVDSVSLSFQDS